MEEVETSSAALPPQADLADDLFNMLSMDDGPCQNSAENSTNDDSAWAGFQTIEQASTSAKTDSTKTVDSAKQSNPRIEDLFSSSPSLESAPATKPQKDVKSDNMSLFEKSNTVSPFVLHQHRLAMLAQQQSLLMATEAQSNGPLKYPVNLLQPGANGTDIADQNWPNASYQVPGMTMLMGHNEMQKLMQMGNFQIVQNAGNSSSFPAASFYNMAQPLPVNGTTSLETSKNPAANSGSSSSSATSTQSTKDYDFSSLTRGLFAKR